MSKTGFCKAVPRRGDALRQWWGQQHLWLSPLSTPWQWGVGVGGRGSLQAALQVCPLSSASPHALISFSEHHTKAQANQWRAYTATLPWVPQVNCLFSVPGPLCCGRHRMCSVVARIPKDKDSLRKSQQNWKNNGSSWVSYRCLEWFLFLRTDTSRVLHSSLCQRGVKEGTAI